MGTAIKRDEVNGFCNSLRTGGCMPIAGVRFGHVAFRVFDVDRSVRWYGDAFGARKIFHAQQEGERPELMFLEFAKGQLVEFFTNGKNKVEPTADTMGYLHFCLVVDD